jgi:hypothetical protein
MSSADQDFAPDSATLPLESRARSELSSPTKDDSSQSASNDDNKPPTLQQPQPEQQQPEQQQPEQPQPEQQQPEQQPTDSVVDQCTASTDVQVTSDVEPSSTTTQQPQAVSTSTTTTTTTTTSTTALPRSTTTTNSTSPAVTTTAPPVTTSSATSTVPTDAESEAEQEQQRLLQADVALLSSPIQVGNGLLLAKKPSILDRITHNHDQPGHVIFWLGELPREQVFITERGTLVERTSVTEVTLTRPTWSWWGSAGPSSIITIPNIVEAKLTSARDHLV